MKIRILTNKQKVLVYKLVVSRLNNEYINLDLTGFDISRVLLVYTRSRIIKETY